MVNVQQVLEALKDAGLMAKPSKCVWGARSLNYLGHMVGLGYVSVPEARVTAIKEYRRPVTKRDLKAFLGTVGYYRRFVPGFAGRAGSLFTALKKGSPDRLCWSDDKCQMHTSICLTLCVPPQFSVYLGLQITSLSTQMRPTEGLVQFCRRFEMGKNVPSDSTASSSPLRNEITQPQRLNA